MKKKKKVKSVRDKKAKQKKGGVANYSPYEVDHNDKYVPNGGSSVTIGDKDLTK